jgi:Na+-driven multidrug efflux pump
MRGTEFDFWASIICNAVWILLGLLCILSALGLVGELLTWWLFGLGLILGGVLGILLTLRGARGEKREHSAPDTTEPLL